MQGGKGCGCRVCWVDVVGRVAGVGFRGCAGAERVMVAGFAGVGRVAGVAEMWTGTGFAGVARMPEGDACEFARMPEGDACEFARMPEGDACEFARMPEGDRTDEMGRGG